MLNEIIQCVATNIENAKYGIKQNDVSDKICEYFIDTICPNTDPCLVEEFTEDITNLTCNIVSISLLEECSIVTIIEIQ